MLFDDLLAACVARGASDIHLHVGLYPTMRLRGRLIPMGLNRLRPAATEGLVAAFCDARQQQVFTERHQVDLAYTLAGVARFRVNLFRQQGFVSAVLRVIDPTGAQLSLVNLAPELLRFFHDQQMGLILISGPTGSGKSTTLARIIDDISSVHEKVVITVEDPIEYLHPIKRSLVIQRELGTDVPSYPDALTAAMRQDPDVIVLGEIRDHATAAAALSAAQSGHLVLGTLHTLDAVRTINRLLALFPNHQRTSVRRAFAAALVGLVSQRLLPKVGGGQVAAAEVLKGTLRVKELLQDENRSGDLYEALHDAAPDGMQRFDDSLANLYARDEIAFTTGVRAATSAQHFRLAAAQIDIARTPSAS